MYPSKYKVRDFSKGSSIMKSLLMQWNDPILGDQKTDTFYCWKCPSHSCTAEYIGETNRPFKEGVSDHRNQTTSAIRNQHISTNHPKAEPKHFTMIDRDSNTLHLWAKGALHISIKDPSLNRNIGKVRIPSVFNKPIKPHTQLEQPHSPIPLSKGAPSLLGLSRQKTVNTSHLLDLHLQVEVSSYVHTLQTLRQLNH